MLQQIASCCRRRLWEARAREGAAHLRLWPGRGKQSKRAGTTMNFCIIPRADCKLFCGRRLDCFCFPRVRARDCVKCKQLVKLVATIAHEHGGLGWGALGTN